MTSLSFLKALRTVVNYHRSCGIRTYADSEHMQDGLAALDAIGRQVIVDRGSAPVSAAAEPSSRVEAAGPSRRVEAAGHDGKIKLPPLSELSAQIAVCNHCSLHESRQVATPGDGGERPVLLVVGDWLGVQTGRTPEKDELFGPDQDLMLAKMIAAIDLAQDNVFVTNIIKCSVPASNRPTSEQIGICSSYLKLQITILSPRIICAMGTAAAQVLTGTSQALSQIRGRFHPCRLPSAQEIPVMPTYHPTYLLRNPEMKQAVWTDLQAIQRELKKEKIA